MLFLSSKNRMRFSYGFYCWFFYSFLTSSIVLFNLYTLLRSLYRWFSKWGSFTSVIAVCVPGLSMIFCVFASYFFLFILLSSPSICSFGCSLIVFKCKPCDYFSDFKGFFSETDFAFYFIGKNGGNLILVQVKGDRLTVPLDSI